MPNGPGSPLSRGRTDRGADSIFKQQARVIARILFGAGYAVVLAPFAGPSFPPPAKPEGMEHRAAHQSFVLPCPLLKDTGASRRSIAAVFSAGPRFLRSASPRLRLSNAAPFGRPHCRASGKPRGPPSASSSRRVIVPAGGAPAPPGRGGYVRPPPAGAASPPAVRTSHDNALGRRGYNRYIII